MKIVWISVFLLVAALYVHTVEGQIKPVDGSGANSGDNSGAGSGGGGRGGGGGDNRAKPWNTKWRPSPCDDLYKLVKYLTYKLEKLTNLVYRIPFDIQEMRRPQKNWRDW